MLTDEVRTTATSFDYRRVRGELATRMLTKGQLAQAAGLGLHHVNMVMRGHKLPGELATYKLREGLQRLGIDPAVAFGPTEHK